MSGLLALIGVVAAIFYIIAPFLTMAWASHARREAERLAGLVLAQQGQIDALHQQVVLLVAQRRRAPEPERAPEREATPVPVARWSPPPDLLPPPAPAAPEAPPAATEEIPAAPEGPPPERAEAPPPPTERPAPEGPPPPLAPLPDPAPVPSLRPAFDWENLLGVRGAAWLGAIALVIAGSLFAKYSIENNLIPPAVRIALILLTAVGALVGSEFVMRRGYGTTANAAAGAGVALLYAGFYAAHGLYQLLPLPATFGLMLLTTLVAVLLSLRHDAMFIAVLGLLGGFATPLVLSTGQDRPVGLFAYILLLDSGLLYVAVRKDWGRLVKLSLAATLFIQGGWAIKHLSPAKMPIALGATLLFALLYLILPSLAHKDKRRDLYGSAFLGGVFPFAFALYMAGAPRYAAQWPLLMGFLLCLSAALIVIALRRDQLSLLVSGALATSATLLLWSGEHPVAAPGEGGGPWLPSLALCALVLLYQLPPLLRRRLQGGLLPRGLSTGPIELAALLAGAALGVYAAVLCLRGLGEPPWLFLSLLLLLCLIGLDRARREGLFLVGALWPLGVALLAQLWFFRTTQAAELLRNLAAPLLLATLYGLWATARYLREGSPLMQDNPRAREGEAGAGLAIGVALMGLLGCVGDTALGQSPVPLLLALTVLLALLLPSPLRHDQTYVHLLGLLAAALLCGAWQGRHFDRSDVATVAPFYGGFYLLFLFLPFLFPAALRPAWLTRRSPYVTAALSGPLFFLPLRSCWTAALGTGAIGVLALVMAGLSVAALALIRGRYAGAPDGVVDEGARAQARLRNLAMLAAVALGFVTVAIPLQLDRQWITLGWTLEALAVWWLYLRLPHWGLKYLGLGLYLTVAARLLLNPEVLKYHERALPVLNWILYTYGVAAATFLLGAHLLREEKNDPDRHFPSLVRLLALALIFWLINLEIADYFSAGRYIELDRERDAAQNLAYSVAWGLYALGLLGVGMWRRAKALRFASLGVLLLTIGKVFLYDLSSLGGLYRVLSFLGLAVALIAVSLLYQRFVFRKGVP